MLEKAGFAASARPYITDWLEEMQRLHFLRESSSFPLAGNPL